MTWGWTTGINKSDMNNRDGHSCSDGQDDTIESGFNAMKIKSRLAQNVCFMCQKSCNRRCR